MRLLKSLVVALLLFSITAHAGTPLVTGEAEHALRAWLAAFNDGDRDALAAFREQYKMRADAKGDLEFRAETGELRVLEVVASTPGKVQMLLLPSANDRVMLVTATLDPDKRSAAFAFEGAQTPAKYQPRRMAMADVLDAAKTRLDALQATGDLGGGVPGGQAGRRPDGVARRPCRS